MAEKLRIHNLSKELGVTSKALVEKCKVEGVEGITGHMSVVSAGLAETIREWFSEGVHKTSVEEAAPVDLQKVRVRRRKKSQEESTADGSVAVEEAPAETPSDEPPAAPAAPEEPSEPSVEAPPLAAQTSGPAGPTAVPAEAPPAIAAETPAPAPETQDVSAGPAPAPAIAPPLAAEAPTAEALAPAAKASPAKVAATAPAHQPAAEGKNEGKKDAIRPAGPQNVPAPVQMRGPRIVGYAKPDPIQRPAPRSRFGPPSGPMPETEESRRSRPGFGRPPGTAATAAEEAAKKNKQRANPRRSGRSVVDVGERLREWNDRDLLERQERLQAASGRGIHAKRAKEAAAPRIPGAIAPRKTRAQVNEPIIINQLSAATGVGLSQMWPKFKNDHNILIARNTVVPAEIAQAVMLEFGVELEVVKPKSELEKVADESANLDRPHLKPRPPVVTMLGHVDHGKTSLLDAIRKTHVARGEAGGITQHIGAYQVERGDLKVTFLDTPGHEAFTSMRARGANMTDVVVLVVAADDGLMPQTIEAINHAKAAKVAIVVALNKIDLPGVDTNKIYGQLSEHQLTPAEWGGDVDVIKTSATTGQGVEELVAHLATLTDLLGLQADPTMPATGIVVEAQMEPGRGALATVLVQEGTLKTGDFVLCGPAAGRVRALRNDLGKSLPKAGPGTPVEISGLDEVPNAGDRFFVMKSLQRAKEVAESVKLERRQLSMNRMTKVKSLEDLFQQRESGKLPELNMILKADVTGSVDAILKVLGDIPDEEVKLNILHTAIGSVSESDVVLAEASEAMIVGFNTTVEPGAQKLADSSGVDIRLYRVIYDVIDDIRKALEGLLTPEKSEQVKGKATIREIFHVTKVGTIAGCMVTEGNVYRSNNVRVIRDGAIIVPTADDAKHGRHRPIASLRRFKDDAREVRAGMECGIRIEGFDDVKPGDVIEAYEVVETARKL